MKKEDVILQRKLTALNSIRKLYHPLNRDTYTYHPADGSRMEQMSYDVEAIINGLEKDLKELKKKTFK